MKSQLLKLCHVFMKQDLFFSFFLCTLMFALCRSDVRWFLSGHSLYFYKGLVVHYLIWNPTSLGPYGCAAWDWILEAF